MPRRRRFANFFPQVCQIGSRPMVRSDPPTKKSPLQPARKRRHASPAAHPSGPSAASPTRRDAWLLAAAIVLLLVWLCVLVGLALV